MNDTTTTTIKQEVDRWIALSGKKQAALAEALAYSPSVISQVLAGKYNGDAASVERVIRQYIANYGRTEKPTLWIETSQTRMAQVAANNAIRTREMAVLHGDAGLGKTYFVRRFLSDRPNAIYLEIVKGQSSRDVLREICAGLKIQPKRSNYQTFCEICANIGDRVIVIDQAEFLRNETLEYIRGIWDRTKTPVILVGIADLVTLVRSHTHIDSRMHWQWQFQPLEDGEIAAILQAKGLSVELAPTIARMARRNFRRSVYLIENAIEIAGGAPITEDTLISAKMMLFI
jgi:DNA transposition AAA+ family ATPase